MTNFLIKLLEYKWLSLVAIILLSAAFFMKMKENSSMETDLDKYMPHDHPAFVYSDKAEEWFGIQDGIIVAIENKNGIYNQETLDTLKSLTKRLQKFDEIEKADVTSLYTADNIIGTEDGMDVKRFYKRVPKTDEKLSKLQQNVRNNEMVYGRLVSENEQVTVIIAEIGDDVFTQEFYNEILETTASFQTDDIIIHVAGRPIIEGTMALLGPADMKKMVPIVILVITLVLLIMLRSIKSTIITMLVVFLSTLWAFGLMAWVNIPIYAVSTMIPVMLIAIGVADGIHLYSHLQLFMRKNPLATKLEAVSDMIKKMWKPVAITSITTSVGFISLLTSQVYPIKYFGIFTAFGVMAAMFFSLVLLPALIMATGLPKVKRKSTNLIILLVFLIILKAFGLMAWINIPIYAVLTMIPVMLIAIGIADGTSLYNHLQLFMRKKPLATKLEVVSDMIKKMWEPVFITSIAISAGFISLLTSQGFPIKYFVFFIAFSVLITLFFSLVLLPVLLMATGLPKAKEAKEAKEEDVHDLGYAGKFADKILKRKSMSMIITALIIVVSVVGMQKIWINSSFLEKFEEDCDIVLTDHFINENFGGTTTLSLILDAGEEHKDVFKQPDVLLLVDKMQTQLETDLQVVGNSFSLTDYVKRMNKVMNADKEAFNTIPDSQDMVAQYLLLYEMSGDPENLNKVVDYDYSKLNITYQLKSDNSKAINSALAIIDTYEDEFKEKGITINYAGSGYKGLIFTDLILEGQIMSLILSLIIVIVLLSLMFKNIKIGLIGAIPIIVTSLVSFGIMGFLNIPLSTTTALLSSIAIGIGIDYAVHFIEQYRLNAEQTGDPIKTAEITMHHSGRAISYNAIVVIAGFLVLLFSVFPPNRQLGALVSLNMFVSFVGTVTIMLVLMNVSKVFFKKK